MSGKFNKQHPDRGRSRYPQRLAARGLSKAPRMEAREVLEARQLRRTEQTGVPWKVWEEQSAEERLLRDIFEGAA